MPHIQHHSLRRWQGNLALIRRFLLATAEAIRHGEGDPLDSLDDALITLKHLEEGLEMKIGPGWTLDLD